jgi:hypothetical protein
MARFIWELEDSRGIIVKNDRNPIDGQRIRVTLCHTDWKRRRRGRG